MSICRWGDDSDVYLYCNIPNERWECQCPHGNHTMSHPREIWDHLTRLEQEGHKVPCEAFERVRCLLTERGYILVLDYAHQTGRNELLDGQGNTLAPGKPPVWLPFHIDELQMNSDGIAFDQQVTR